MGRGFAAGLLVLFLIGASAALDLELCAEDKTVTSRAEWSPVRPTSTTFVEAREPEDHIDSILNDPIDETRTTTRVLRSSDQRDDPNDLPVHRTASLNSALDALYFHDDGSVQYGRDARCGSPSCGFCRDFFQDRVDCGLGNPYWIPQFQGGWVRAEYLLLVGKRRSCACSRHDQYSRHAATSGRRFGPAEHEHLIRLDRA